MKYNITATGQSYDLVKTCNWETNTKNQLSFNLITINPFRLSTMVDEKNIFPSCNTQNGHYCDARYNKEGIVEKYELKLNEKHF